MLALLFYEHAEWPSSRHWWQQAVRTGDQDVAPWAMVDLGGLEAEQGNPAGARDWLQQAVRTGHQEHAPRAMVNLGGLEAEQGDPAGARDWLQQAVRAGHPEISSQAEQKLAAHERHESDKQRGEQFGRYGYLAYADPELMRRDDHSPDSSVLPTGTGR